MSKDPAAGVVARIDVQEDVCGSDPPVPDGDDGRVWGDCWCTRLPGHDGDCACEICQARFGAPGWPKL